MKYVEPQSITREQAEKQFATGLQYEICDALVRVTYTYDEWQWAQGCCLRFIEHEDPGIRGVAANCLGDLARIHRCLDLDKVVPVLRRLLSDPEMGGRAEDALEDIEIFMGTSGL